jgi:hypothetical protein
MAIYRLKTFDGCVEIKRCFFGYKVYDCGSPVSWHFTFKGAKRYGEWVAGVL